QVLRAGPAARPVVRLVDPGGALLVLGSTQPDEVVDAARAASADVPVARRRSGGGAVLVRPGETVWVDVSVPRSDVLWDDDVHRAFLWLGAAWVAALAALGVAAIRHEGAASCTAWSGLV